MNSRYIWIIGVVCFLQLGCEDADNGELTIHNATDRQIRIYYEYEVVDETDEQSLSDEEDDVVETHFETEVISLASEETIILDIASSDFYKGSIDSVYGGIVKYSEIDFDFFDTAEITFTTSDYFSEVLSF